MRLIQVVFVITSALQCNGVSYSEQLDHIARRRLESLGLYRMAQNKLLILSTRRFNPSHGEMSVIMGAPSMPSHLPEAEAILPGHTLVRPAIGMLKSAIKFPHKDPDNGAGVYGNYENIGIKYDGRNERVMYSGFRRMLPEYIMVAPTKLKSNGGLRFSLHPVKIDQDLKLTKSDLLKNRDQMRPRKKRRLVLGIYPSHSKVKQKLLYDDKEEPTHSKLIELFANPSLWLNNNKDKADKRKFNTNQLIKKSNYYGERKLNNLKESVNAHSNETNSSVVHQREKAADATRNIDPSSIEGDLDKLFKEDHPNQIEPSDTTDRNKEKFNWFLESKNAFNHVKIDIDAPNHSEIMPDDSNKGNNLRNWWFYHQDDFEPFKSME